MLRGFGVREFNLRNVRKKDRSPRRNREFYDANISASKRSNFRHIPPDSARIGPCGSEYYIHADFDNDL